MKRPNQLIIAFLLILLTMNVFAQGYKNFKPAV